MPIVVSYENFKPGNLQYLQFSLTCKLVQNDCLKLYFPVQ